MAAPQASSASAPRLASFSTSTGSPSRASASAAASTPTHPGRIEAALDGAGGAVDRRRQTHPDADHPRPVGAGLLEHLVDELRRGGQPVVGRVVDVQLPPGLGEDGVGEVGDGDAQVAVAEVDPDREPGRGVERDHHRRSAGVRLAARLAVALARQPGVEQVGDDRRDGRAREARDPGKLGATGDSALSQGVDHTFPVALPKGGQRAASPPHSAGISFTPPSICQAFVKIDRQTGRDMSKTRQYPPSAYDRWATTREETR